LQIIVAVAINKERPLLPPDTPPRLASLISRCWLEDPAARPRVAQLATELQDMMQVGALCFQIAMKCLEFGCSCLTCYTVCFCLQRMPVEECQLENLIV
jgi:hypothetical protein